MVNKMKTRLIEFPNRNGLLLRGFFHEPEHSHGSPKDLVVFPNGGLMGCEGDFRAYVRIARYLVENGFYVFRFSPFGLGLSDGLIEDCKRVDLFIKIETGMFVEDIKAALKFVKSGMVFNSITLAGVCGGAISSFIAASQIDDVKNVIPIGMPIVLDNADGDYKTRIPEEEAKFIFKIYMSKFFSPLAWWRFMRGKSDWQTIKMIFNKLIIKEKDYISNDQLMNGFSINKEYIKAAGKNIGKKNILFIFGNTDISYIEFNNYFLKGYFFDDEDRPFDMHILNNGNHMLTWVEMQKEAAEKICAWLNIKNRENL
jgi:pimeloyl-ACP methyl ester carboxylesterase